MLTRISNGQLYGVLSKRCIVAQFVLVLLLLLVSPLSAYAADSGRMVRIAGETRYDTMEQIVNVEFRQCDEAVVAAGNNFPDALSASALAGKFGCPVVLTASAQVSESAVRVLSSLGAKHAYIVGGSSAVSPTVEASLKGMGISTTRVAGKNRAETSVEVLKQVAGESDTVIIATGKNFADSLSIGPWSYASKSPIVLTGADGLLTPSEVAAIRDAGYERYLIVGGDVAVSAGVESQLADLQLRGRLGGANRYATSAAIISWELGEGGMTCAYPGLATGRNFPDALAGAALCGARNSVMGLADVNKVSAVDAMASVKDSIVMGMAFGGEIALSPAAYNALASLVGAQLETGWAKIAGKWYYFNEKGALQTGLATIEGNKFYFDTKTGAMKTDAFQDIDGKKYYFSSDGVMADAGFVKGYVISYNGVCRKVDQRNTGNADADARRVAKVIAESCGPKEGQTDLDRVTRAAYTVSCFCNQARYTTEGNIYWTAYGVFIAREYSCAGATRALGLVLDYLGYSWTHANPNQWTHQWCRLTMDGKKGYADGQAGYVGYGKHPMG